MNKYTLNVYDDDFEIVKTFEAAGIKWGKLVEIYEKASNPEKYAGNEMTMLEDVMMSIFPTATHEDLQNCLFEDMAALLKNIMVMGAANGLASKTGGGAAAKN